MRGKNFLERQAASHGNEGVRVRGRGDGGSIVDSVDVHCLHRDLNVVHASGLVVDHGRVVVGESGVDER